MLCWSHKDLSSSEAARSAPIWLCSPEPPQLPLAPTRGLVTVAPIPHSLLRTQAVALDSVRSREAVRQWVPATALPATREQLTAYLMGQGAPNWLIWRLNACVPLNRVVGSPEELVELMGQTRTGTPVPSPPYAG